MTRTILSVKIRPMYLIPSQVVVQYEEGNYKSFFVEEGSIEELCNKYQIFKGENDYYGCSHLTARKCKVAVKDGKTFFEGYSKRTLYYQKNLNLYR